MAIQFVRVDQVKNDLLEVYLEDGITKQRKVQFKPKLYLDTKKESEYKNFFQTGNVKPVEFENYFEMQQFVKMYRDKMQLWGDLSLVTQYMNERNYDSDDTSKLLYSIIDIEVCSTIKNADGSYTDGGFPDAEHAAWPINAICEYRSDTKRFSVFTTAPGWTRENSHLKYKENVDYYYFKTEEELLETWIKFFRNPFPHILSGWNSNTFDIPYIINRITNLFGENKAKSLSPWRILRERKSKGEFNREDLTYEIYGINCLDYLDLYKKFQLAPRMNYKLEFISVTELGEDKAKLQFEGTHGTFYYEDPAGFVDYNVQDVYCVSEFEKLLRFINLTAYMGYMAIENFDNVRSPLATWEHILYSTYTKEKIIPPIKPSQAPEREEYAGAYVHEPVPGFKSCIVSFDFTSLYPSLIRQFYMFYDTLVMGKEREQIRKECIDALRNNNETEMLHDYMTNGNFHNYAVSHDRLPECFSDVLRKYHVSCSPYMEFFKLDVNSLFVKKLTSVFFDRKKNKKISTQHKLKAKEIAKVLETRGIHITDH